MRLNNQTNQTNSAEIDVLGWLEVTRKYEKKMFVREQKMRDA
jgi:hypothetical protein